MWPLRKHAADLEEGERALLKRLFAYSPDLERAYGYREQLTALFEGELSKEQARQKLKNWQKQVRASGLRCYDSFLQALGKWREELTNYFLERNHSGFVEGLNTKLQVLKRRCYGICNLPPLFQRIFLDLEGYRLFARPVC
jgi:transposase